MSLKFTKSDHKDKNFAVSSHCSYNLHYQIVFKSRLWTNCKAIFHYDKFMWVLCFTRFVNVATNTTTRSFIVSRKKSSWTNDIFFSRINPRHSLFRSLAATFPLFSLLSKEFEKREKKRHVIGLSSVIFICHWSNCATPFLNKCHPQMTIYESLMMWKIDMTPPRLCKE